MPSPFAGIAENASLTFTVATGGLEEDEETGNLAPAMKPVILVAFLKVATKGERGLPKALEHPGVDELEEIFAGYLTRPMTLPQAIAHLAVAEAVISGIRGTFKLYKPVPSAFPVVTQVLGDRIYGVFRRAV